MRTIFANKAITPTGASFTATGSGRCPDCGQPAGRRCREGSMGWYCWTSGKLRIDPDKLIHPTPDPIGPLEQAVIDSLAEPMASAQARVDAALVKFTETQMVWLQVSSIRRADRSTKKMGAAQARFDAARTGLEKARGKLADLERRLETGRKAAKHHDLYPPAPDDEDD